MTTHISLDELPLSVIFFMLGIAASFIFLVMERNRWR